MGKSKTGDVNSFFGNTLVISFIPSFIITIYCLSHFSLIGIPFVILLVFGTIWFSVLVASVLSIFAKGELSLGKYHGAGGATVIWAGTFLASILLDLLVLFLYLGIHLVPSRNLIWAKGNPIASFFWGLVITAVSVIPFIAVVWLILQFVH